MSERSLERKETVSSLQRNRALFSHDSHHWATPRTLYDALDNEFHFTLDPCPERGNQDALWHGAEVNGLARPWSGHRVYCNPPYGPRVSEWLRKANEAEVAVFLLPARTDTRWWHEYAMKADEIRFLRGRLRFGAAQNSAPFPSVILVFRNGAAKGTIRV